MMIWLTLDYIATPLIIAAAIGVYFLIGALAGE